MEVHDHFQVTLTLYPDPTRDKKEVNIDLYPWNREATKSSISSAFDSMYSGLKRMDVTGIIPVEGDIIWSSLTRASTTDARMAIVHGAAVISELRGERQSALNLCFKKLIMDKEMDDEIIAMFVDAIQRLWPSNKNLASGGVLLRTPHLEEMSVWTPTDEMRT